jgi:hypothetical protein
MSPNATLQGCLPQDDMIGWLRTAKSAYYYKKRKRLPKTAIVELFRAIRQKSETPSNNIFRHVKQPLGHASWSAIAFFYERDPAFLDGPAGYTRERVCGFLLLVEHRDHVVLFKSNLDVPSGFKTEYFHRVGDDRVEAAIARADATFEQIRLRNMATSKHALRFKTLEADDLQSVIGPSGASRYVPRGYRVRRGADHYTATPSTGRISLRSDRATYQDLVNWAVLVIDMLVDENIPPSTFIRTFARPIDLDSIPAGVWPTYIAVDVPTLTEDLFEAPEGIRLFRSDDGDAVVLNKNEVDAVLAVLDQAFAVRRLRGELRIINPLDNVQIGNINVGKTRISLRSFEIPDIQDVYVGPVNPTPGEEDAGTPIKRYIDQNDLYTILFNDLAIVYLDGALYRDDSLADGRQFLSYIKTDPRLSATTSEKGTFSAVHTAFDADSVFRILIDHIADRDELLICDDLGDEWADFIGVNGSSQPKTISFYHVKHGAPSLGALHLHTAVSQAMKNLGRMNLAANEIAAKLPKWTAPYSNNNVVTLIQRVVRGDAAMIRERIIDALSSPDTIRRVFIVTSSLSRRQLEEKFVAIRGGEAPTPHFVQLYWLLTSFFSACAEVGAYPYVVCQE